MKSLLHGLAAGLAMVAVLLQPGCSASGADESPKLTIDRVGWYEENIDPSFWAVAPPSDQTAYYDFFIRYTGDITFADLQSVRVYTPDGHFWNILPDARFLDPVNKVIGGLGRWYGSPGSVLPIGDLRVEVTLSDGSVVTSTRNVPAPGSTTAGSFTTMHTEDALAPSADSAPMVRRVTMATGGTFDDAAQAISFSFSIADPLAHNGWVWLYDAAGTYLGAFFPFRDAATGAVAAQLGGVLHTDGTANTVTLHPADVQLEPAALFSQIEKVRVVMTDGKQYLPQTTGAYDCRSVGPVTTLTLQ